MGTAYTRQVTSVYAQSYRKAEGRQSLVCILMWRHHMVGWDGVVPYPLAHDQGES